jgi:hypothetical protein
MTFKKEKEIVANVATEVTGYKVTAELLESRTRKREVVIARQVLMKIMRDEGMTLSAVGSCFGKDHATVLHAVKTVNRDLDANYQLTTKIYEKSRELVLEAMMLNFESSKHRYLTLEEKIQRVKVRARLREENAFKEAREIVNYALLLMERGNAQGWAKHKLKLKVATSFSFKSELNAL